MKLTTNAKEMTTEDKELEIYVSEEVLDPLSDFPKECVCGGTIFPIYDDNPHFGSFCDKCD
ncbi:MULTISPECIES: hypothetical protein [Bacillus amyloliquefaciens group]|uniref:hypothetical protein n=1 Tax=Bacillus amyloliquefaciens group TaxID=1938374 RepID=UPI002E1B7132|nr:hypothetical protein [Bacillus velezensis]